MNYNGLYALIGLNEQSEEYIIRIDNKPHLPDDGFPMWRPIVDSPPAYDPATQNRTQNAQEAWTIGAESVVVTYTVTDRPVEDVRSEKLASIRADAQAHILSAYPLWVQTNIAMGIYPADVGDPAKTWIASVITESNRCEALVNAAATLADIVAVTPIWPEVA
jgi:hypothetical protein